MAPKTKEVWNAEDRILVFEACCQVCTRPLSAFPEKTQQEHGIDRQDAALCCCSHCPPAEDGTVSVWLVTWEDHPVEDGCASYTDRVETAELWGFADEDGVLRKESHRKANAYREALRWLISELRDREDIVDGGDGTQRPNAAMSILMALAASEHASVAVEAMQDVAVTS